MVAQLVTTVRPPDAGHATGLIRCLSLEGPVRPRAFTLSAAGLMVIACALLPGLARAQSGAAPAVAPAGAVATPIGKIVTLKGTVNVEHASAVVVAASVAGSGGSKVGDLVYKGDVVSTGADGSVGINFSDGTAFNISSNARMELNEFVYDPKGKSNSTFFSLSKGTFTFIAGKVAKTGDMKIDTPVATMGIRGTTPHVEIRDDGTVTFSTLVEDKKAIEKAIEKIEKKLAEPLKKEAKTIEPPSTPSTPATPSVTTPVRHGKKAEKKPDSSYEINVGYKICRGC
jgi:FecR protein